MESQAAVRSRLASTLINRLRLKHIALLSALGERCNLHLAAEAVRVSQPTATKMLADIEQAFGFRLFERLPRGMRPTLLGREVVGFATRDLGAFLRFAQDLEDKQRGGHGVLAVGAIMGVAADVIAPAVAALKQQRPRLLIRITGETSDQVIELLGRGDIELAIGRFAQIEQHNDYRFEPLANETLRVVVRASHPLAAKSRIELPQLIDWPWVLQPLSSPARILLESEFAVAGLPSPQDTVECASIFATFQILLASERVAMLPESVVRDYLRSGILVSLPLRIGEGLGSFGILTRRDDLPSEPAAAFMVELRRACAKPNTPRSASARHPPGTRAKRAARVERRRT